MIRHLLHVDFQPGRGLQEQVRETLVNAILSGIFAADTPLPSCRQLASQLRVSRNTTALVFESLVNEGYLISRPRSGYYLHPDYHEASPAAVESAPQREAAAPRWGDRLQMTPSQQESILKPAGWMHYRYPFIYGQPDTRQFPLATWRSAAYWLNRASAKPSTPFCSPTPRWCRTRWMKRGSCLMSVPAITTMSLQVIRCPPG